MKKLTPFLQPFLFFAIALTGILIGTFTGGFMAGSGVMLLLFVTTGKVLAKKATESLDKKYAAKHKVIDALREIEKNRDMQ